MPTRASSCLAWIWRSTEPETPVLVSEEAPGALVPDSTQGSNNVAARFATLVLAVNLQATLRNGGGNARPKQAIAVTRAEIGTYVLRCEPQRSLLARRHLC
jgi:hypothetical protein